MENVKVFLSIDQMKTGDADQQKAAKAFLFGYIVDHRLPEKACRKLIGLLEIKDCQEAVKTILLEYVSHFDYLSEKAWIELIDLLKIEDCRNVTKMLLLDYVKRFEFEHLPEKACRRLIGLLEIKDCQAVAKDIVLEYINVYTVGCWGAKLYKHPLSVACLSQLNGLLKKKDYQVVAEEIYLVHAENYHLAKEAEVNLVKLLKVEGCRDIVKKIIWVYANSKYYVYAGHPRCNRLSVVAEQELVGLLWKDNYRDVAKSVLLDYANDHFILSQRAQAKLRKLLRLACFLRRKEIQDTINEIILKCPIE